MRARSLKPGFFKNEELALIPMAARLLFQGLWCMADREGRLEDRSLRIKAEVLPYDSEDVPKLLGMLSDHGFIRRYDVAGKKYIQIVNFCKHQNPHKQEQPSIIPKPSEELRKNIRTSSEVLRLTPSSLTPHSLTPDSPLLTPDSNTFCPDPQKAADHGPLFTPIPAVVQDLRLYREDKKLCAKIPLVWDDWKKAYPDINLQSEIIRAHTWELTHHIKKDRIRFLSNWFSRSQDNPKGNSNVPRTAVSSNVRLTQTDPSRRDAYSD